MSPNYILARVNPDTTALPEGWTWWDYEPDFEPEPPRTSWRDTPAGLDPTDVEAMLGPDEILLDEEPERRYVRALGYADLRAAAARAVETWMHERETGRADTAGTMVATLPDGWRSLAMRRLGYSTPAHAALVGAEPAGLETYLRQSVASLDDTERYAWMSDTPWEALDLWRTRTAPPPRRTPTRAARAVAGTPLPEGWVEREHGMLSTVAPLEMDSTEAMRDYMAAGHSTNTAIVVSDTLDPDGRVLVWRGVGGAARQVGGTWPDRASALRAALEAVTADRAPYRWIPNMPEVEVISARSPGWEAIREAERVHAELRPGGLGIRVPEHRTGRSTGLELT